jgi:hypothetical protein
MKTVWAQPEARGGNGMGMLKKRVKASNIKKPELRVCVRENVALNSQMGV